MIPDADAQLSPVSNALWLRSPRAISFHLSYTHPNTPRGVDLGSPISRSPASSVALSPASVASSITLDSVRDSSEDHASTTVEVLSAFRDDTKFDSLKQDGTTEAPTAVSARPSSRTCVNQSAAVLRYVAHAVAAAFLLACWCAGILAVNWTNSWRSELDGGFYDGLLKDVKVCTVLRVPFAMDIDGSPWACRLSTNRLDWCTSPPRATMTCSLPRFATDCISSCNNVRWKLDGFDVMQGVIHAKFRLWQVRSASAWHCLLRFKFVLACPSQVLCWRR